MFTWVVCVCLLYLVSFPRVIFIELLFINDVKSTFLQNKRESNSNMNGFYFFIYFYKYKGERWNLQCIFFSSVVPNRLKMMGDNASETFFHKNKYSTDKTITYKKPNDQYINIVTQSLPTTNKDQQRRTRESERDGRLS